jgi:hypothetical protein
MKRLTCVFAFSLLVMAALSAPVFAQDTVYLKDGSIIHGTITEEIPGQSIKIETKDGNVFVYKMKAIKKITHSAKADQADDQGDEQQAEELDSQGEEGTVDQVSQAPPPQAHKKKKKKKVVPSNNYSAPEPVVNDSHAHFNKFAFTVNAGAWAPYVNTEFNNALEAGSGTDAYDYLPGWAKAGVGIGWFTNNIALKWNVQFSYQPNNYSTDWYYGGYYAGTTEEDTSIISVGSEVEADFGLDSIINANNVMTVYIPLIAGVWAQEWVYSDSAGDYENFYNTTTDFGTGIGIRGFDSSNFLWDMQLVYRWSTRGNYLTDGYGDVIPDGQGDYIDANVSGFDCNFMMGFLFQ